MKKLFTILSLFITTISYSQPVPDTAFLKIKIGGGKTDLSNYYNKDQVNDSLASKIDTSYKFSISAKKPLRWEVVNKDSANLKMYLDSTINTSDSSVPTSNAVKSYVDNNTNWIRNNNDLTTKNTTDTVRIGWPIIGGPYSKNSVDNGILRVGGVLSVLGTNDQLVLSDTVPYTGHGTVQQKGTIAFDGRMSDGTYKAIGGLRWYQVDTIGEGSSNQDGAYGRFVFTSHNGYDGGNGFPVQFGGGQVLLGAAYSSTPFGEPWVSARGSSKNGKSPFSVTTIDTSYFWMKNLSGGNTSFGTNIDNGRGLVQVNGTINALRSSFYAPGDQVFVTDTTLATSTHKQTANISFGTKLSGGYNDFAEIRSYYTGNGTNRDGKLALFGRTNNDIVPAIQIQGYATWLGGGLQPTDSFPSGSAALTVLAPSGAKSVVDVGGGTGGALSPKSMLRYTIGSELILHDTTPTPGNTLRVHGISLFDSAATFLASASFADYMSIKTPTGNNVFKFGNSNSDAVPQSRITGNNTYLTMYNGMSITNQSATTTNSILTLYNNVSANRFTVLNSGNVGIGQVTPTASLHIQAGTATTGTAPIKLTAGTNLTTPENGAIEFDGTDYYLTSNSIRYTLTRTLIGTAAPTTTPLSVGVHFIDTTNKKEYVSTGTSSSSDWILLN